MTRLTPAQYDALERAIIDRRRIVVHRRGTEYVLLPDRLRADGRTELLEAIHPATGERLTLVLDELDDVHPVG